MAEGEDGQKYWENSKLTWAKGSGFWEFYYNLVVQCAIGLMGQGPKIRAFPIQNGEIAKMRPNFDELYLGNRLESRRHRNQAHFRN